MAKPMSIRMISKGSARKRSSLFRAFGVISYKRYFFPPIATGRLLWSCQKTGHEEGFCLLVVPDIRGVLFFRFAVEDLNLAAVGIDIEDVADPFADDEVPVSHFFNAIATVRQVADDL